MIQILVTSCMITIPLALHSNAACENQAADPKRPKMRWNCRCNQ